jgi:hypothetical protein
VNAPPNDRLIEPETAEIAGAEPASGRPAIPIQRSGLDSRGRLAVAGLLLLGLLLRLPGLPLLGTGDTYIWKVWAYTAATRGVTHVYPLKGRADWPPLTLAAIDQVRHGKLLPGWNTYNRHSGPTDYPPGALYVLWGVGKLYQAVFAPTFADSATFNVLVKIPLVLADAGIAALIFWAVRRRGTPGRSGVAWVAAGAYWGNPTAIVAGSILGYYDALYGLPLVAALGALAVGRYALGWVGWAAALMVKIQALVLGPALGLLSLRRGPARLVAYGGAAVGTLGLVCLPFLARGTFVGVLAGVGANTPGLGAATYEDYLSANQVNLWWLWSYFWEWNAEHKGPGVLVRIVPPSMIQEMGIADLNLWGEALFVAFFVLTAAIWWFGSRGRGDRRLRVTDLFLVPLQFYGATMLLPSIHENHLLLAIPLLALLVGLAAVAGPPGQLRRLAVLYGALSLIVGLNLVLFYGFGKGAWAPVPRMWFGLDGTVLLAAANVVLFVVTFAVWSVGLLARPRRGAELRA